MLNDFTAAKFFREAEKERTGGTGMWPHPLGLGGRGAGEGRSQGRWKSARNAQGLAKKSNALYPVHGCPLAALKELSFG